MGLFSSKKENNNNNNNNLPAPPAVNTTPSVPQQAPPSVSSLPTEGNLIAPPIPGSNSLNDIKSEVSAPSTNNASAPVVKSESPKIDNSLKEDTTDSLFDLSELEMPELESTSNTQMPELESNLEDSNLSEAHEVDTNVHSEEDLGFVSNKGSHSRSKQLNENYYITTSQFKSLLEIVESVKSKVKEASETHLRLMDIKSEEDIEYENLRKSFQFVEDKLYEVDSLIFDK